MKVLVVDDEPGGRDAIMQFLQRMSSVQEVLTAGSGLEAIEKIIAGQPDVLLLDIDLGGMSGFEVLAAVPEHCNPQVVFVTAHDEYAVQAFEKNAVDYLLKPVSEKRLRDAIAKCQGRAVGAVISSPRARVSELLSPRSFCERFIGKKGPRYYVIEAKSILYFQLSNELVYIVSQNDRLSTNYALKHLELLLDPAVFRRFSRHSIVNLRAVREFSPLGHGSYIARLLNGEDVEVSRQYAPAVKVALGWEI